MKTLNDYVVLKITTRKSSIALPGESQKDYHLIESIEVFDVNEENKLKLKKDQQVRIENYILNQVSRMFNPFKEVGKKPASNEFYIWVKEQEIIAKF